MNLLVFDRSGSFVDLTSSQLRQSGDGSGQPKHSHSVNSASKRADSTIATGLVKIRTEADKAIWSDGRETHGDFDQSVQDKFRIKT